MNKKTNMSSNDKSRLRQFAFWISFSYVLTFTTIMFYLHVNKYEVISFWPIFSGTIGFLTSIGIANYMTTPKGSE